MSKRSSSGMEILLGLLAIEPMSGYNLGQSIRSSVKHFWNESYGQIYPNLKKLADGGYVRFRTERQKGKPERRVYSITEKGRERLRNWLAVPPQPEIPRNELLLKLFFGDQVSADILIPYVEASAEQCRAVLNTLDRAMNEGINPNQQLPAAPYWRMAVRFGQMEMQAHLRWAQETLTQLRQLAKQRDSSKAAQE